MDNYNEMEPRESSHGNAVDKRARNRFFLMAWLGILNLCSVKGYSQIDGASRIRPIIFPVVMGLWFICAIIILFVNEAEKTAVHNSKERRAMGRGDKSIAVIAAIITITAIVSLVLLCLEGAYGAVGGILVSSLKWAIYEGVTLSIVFFLGTRKG